jgi:uncharacterized membrane-anchored protein YhcB (DUF1043 family)
MVLYFALAVCIILGVAIGRIIVEYASSSDRLSTSVKAYQRLIDEHKHEMDGMKAQAREARKRVHALVQACSDTDRKIHEHVETLEEVQSHLERRRPKARQVDIDRDKGDDTDDREDTTS